MLAPHSTLPRQIPCVASLEIHLLHKNNKTYPPVNPASLEIHLLHKNNKTYPPVNPKLRPHPHSAKEMPPPQVAPKQGPLTMKAGGVGGGGGHGVAVRI